MQCAKWHNLFRILTFAAIMFVGSRVAEAATFSCTLKDVVVYSNRIHCQCTTTTPDGSSNIRYFAVSTADAKLADRLMTICTTILISGRRFIAGYTSGDVSGSSFGCGSSDCRKLNSFGIE
jgi:hypothetical protein